MLQYVTTRLSRGMRLSFFGNWPSGMFTAPATWPAAYSLGPRTSITIGAAAPSSSSPSSRASINSLTVHPSVPASLIIAVRIRHVYRPIRASRGYAALVDILCHIADENGRSVGMGTGEHLMRADRLLSILLLLQVHRRITAGELARRLEVSERTIHRDMQALGMAGIPVTAERGTGGGWRLLAEYRTNLTGLNEAEIQALFLTRPPRVLADLGLDKAAEAGLIKLLAAMPSVSRRGAEDVRQRIHVDVSGWSQSAESVPLLPVLQDAVWQERRLRMSYE